jgi:hypothetical protein
MSGCILCIPLFITFSDQTSTIGRELNVCISWSNIVVWNWVVI